MGKTERFKMIFSIIIYMPNYYIIGYEYPYKMDRIIQI